MNMKKILAFTLAGAMIFSTPVLAANSPTADAIGSGSSTSTDGAGSSTSTDGAGSSTSTNGAGSPTASVIAGSYSGGSYSGGGSAWGDAVAGVPDTAVVGAAAEGKSVGEYMNNAVTELPGLDEVTPLGQGGQVIINGAPSNQVFATLKPTIAEVSLAKAQAVALGGKVLNVARIKASVSFETASVNFYMPGVKSGQNIQVYQLVNGQWNQLTVSEIREDHVVVNMTSLGTLAFIEAAAQ